MSYLFPVPARPLRSLLDCKASTGGEFTEDEATLDLMLMMDAGKTESLRTLSERWKWSRMTTSRRLETMQKTVLEWRSWNVGQRGTEVGQRGTKTASNDSKNTDDGTEVGQRGTEVGQPLYIHPRASELDRTTELQNNTRKNSDNNEELNAGETAPPSASSSFDLSFLSDRDVNYEPDIRAVLAHYRPTDARDLLVQQWRRRRVPPTNGILQLLTTHGWEVYAAAVVISSDTDAPNLNFLSSICQRLTAQRHEQHSQNIRPEVPTGDDEAGIGIPVYNLVPHAGAAMPGGVRTGRAGGHQPPRRNQGAYKRPGERTYREHLEAAGYTPEEIATLYPPADGPDRSAGLPDRGARDDDAPGGIVVHIRPRGQQGAA